MTTEANGEPFTLWTTRYERLWITRGERWGKGGLTLGFPSGPHEFEANRD